jgi:hypothetical protein
MVAKAARLQAELEYHDVEVKGAAELQKKKDDIKKLMMLKELAVTNAEIEAVNKVEEEEFGFPSLNQRSLQDNADNRDDRLHDYLETLQFLLSLAKIVACLQIKITYRVLKLLLVKLHRP